MLVSLGVEVLMRTDVTVPARAMLCKSVVYTVLLYGIKSWVVIGAMLKVL